MSRNEIVSRLRKFKNDFQYTYHIKRIGVFGSVARNENSKESDIDVVVELEKRDLFDLIGIKQDLEELLNSSIDIVSYREKMKPFLKKKIDNEAVYV